MGADVKSIGASIMAGAFGALSSVFGKLGGGDVSLFGSMSLPTYVMNPKVLVALRLASYGGLILCNICMWSAHVTSLNKLSSVQATAINTSANFFMSAIFGKLFFGELLSSQWFLGYAFITAGLLLLLKASRESSDANLKTD